MIFTSITCALKASFAMLSIVLEVYEKHQTFSLKGNSQKTFLIPKFVIDTIN